MNLFKKLFYFTLIFSSLFLFTNDVSAITFTTTHNGSKTKVCSDDNFNYYACSDSKVTRHDYIKWISGKNDYAYCADRNKDFKGKTSYTYDNTYNNAKTCKYYLPTSSTTWKQYQGDCSSIVGYVIAAAWDKNVTGITDSKKSWHYAQTAIWTYLGKYGASPYNKYNTSSSSAWTNNSLIKKIIQTAWKKYGAASSIIENSEKDDVNFDVSITDYKFRYTPNGSDCNGGNYITKPIVITNKENRSINISIPVTNDAVSICQKGTSKCATINGDESLDIVLPAKGSVTVYMSTSYILDENVTFSVFASYEENKKISQTIYNSERYDKKGYQGVIILKKSTQSTNASVIHKSNKSYSFSQVAIKHLTCPSTSNNSSNITNNNVYSKNNSNNPVKKVCASNATVDENGKITNSAEYEVYFSGCNCMIITLNDGSKVNVLLSENVGFRFGTLNPTSVYPGGGFKLYASSDEGSGISTTYQSNITWQYADFVTNSGSEYPYYYNPKNLASDNASNRESEIVAKIKEKILEKGQIDLNVSTRDSNDAENTSLTIIPISLNLSSVSYNSAKKLFSFQSGDINMNHAYFATDGTVSYGTASTNFSIDGGNKYYVPVHYDLNEFPFNIGLTNLSSLPNGSFYYQADCDVDIDGDNYLYGSNGVRYRSISLSNPFPKATTKSQIAYNWQDWYWQNVPNINRLKNTFQNYPSQPLYSVSMNYNKLSKINSLKTLYTSWSNIKASDGTSDFVIGGYFDKYPNGGSYCKIGEFSTSCDK